MTKDERWSRVAVAADCMDRDRECIVAVSGYFNPLTTGHLDLIEGAWCIANRFGGPRLVVIVNNDDQVRLKGSCPFMPEDDRVRIVGALSCVTWALLAVDEDRSVSRTLELLRPHVFANGGDVSSAADCRERETCERLGIEMEFGVGGGEKTRSSSALISGAVSWSLGRA